MIGLIRRFVLQYMVTAPDCCAMGWDTNCTSNHGSGHFYAAYIGVSTHVLPIVRAAWCSLFSWCRQITRPFHHCIQLFMKYIGLRRRYVYPYARVPILKRLHKKRPFHNGDKGCFGLANRWLTTVLHLDISDLWARAVVGGNLPLTRAYIMHGHQHLLGGFYREHSSWITMFSQRGTPRCRIIKVSLR